MSLSIVKPCKQLMKNSSLIDAVDKIVKDVHHTESVITVFTHVSLSLRQGWKYSHELQQLESDPIHTFGEDPSVHLHHSPFKARQLNMFSNQIQQLYTTSSLYILQVFHCYYRRSVRICL